MKEQQKIQFIRALAEFLGGTNQARMSIALQLGGEFGKVAKLWSDIRSNTPLFGYLSVDEAEKELKEFLKS
jgi:hypothetical protein